MDNLIKTNDRVEVINKNKIKLDFGRSISIFLRLNIKTNDKY